MDLIIKFFNVNEYYGKNIDNDQWEIVSLKENNVEVTIITTFDDVEAGWIETTNSIKFKSDKVSFQLDKITYIDSHYYKFYIDNMSKGER